jgi:hypothetical protein
MLIVEEKVVYEAFGMKINSEIPLPELAQFIVNKNTLIDIEIKIKDLSGIWDLKSGNTRKLFIDKERVVFEVKDLAIFSIEEGNKIFVSPINYDEDTIRLYLLGSCMGAILLQKKVLPLHGSAVVINGKAYGFIGESGAGKSTLALAFSNKGYKILTDDIIAISHTVKSSLPYVIPSYPQQKLWQESLKEFGVESKQFRSIQGRETKYCVPMSSQYYAEPLPLAGIFELIKTNDNEIGMVTLNNLEQIYALFRHTYRNFLIQGLDINQWHFNISTDILKHVKVLQVNRTIHRFSAPELVSTIIDSISKGEE